MKINNGMKLFALSMAIISTSAMMNPVMACGMHHSDDKSDSQSMTAPSEISKPEAMTSTTNLFQTAANADQFKTLTQALSLTGLDKALSGTERFTVFAPTDDAFAKLPPGKLESLLRPENREQLRRVLTYHVISGEYPTDRVLSNRRLETLDGKELKVYQNDGVAHVNDASLINTDINTANGIIHPIDTVLMP